MNDGLDAFRENLNKRYEVDQIISPSITIVLVLIPYLYYLALKYVLFNRYYELVYQEDLLSSIAMITTLFIYMAITFSLYSRLRSHARRDTEWRIALIQFAEYKGADISELKEIHDRITSRDRFPMYYPLGMLLGFIIVASAAVIIIENIEWNLILAILLSPAVITMVLATPANVLYPHRHETEQIEFTKALKRCLEPVGIEISEMPNVVKSRGLKETAKLLVKTFGLYILYATIMIFVNMNRHLRYQHSYERVLLAQLEGRNVELKLDVKGGFVRTRKKPKALLISELFLVAICLVYLMRISGVALDLINNRSYVTIISDLGLEEFYQGGMLLAYMILMALAIFAMVGIASGRVYSWRKVIRSCMLFLIPVMSSLFIYNVSSYTHMFDLNPYLSLAAVYGIVLLMLLSLSIRRYYTPMGRKMPPVKDWIRFVFYGNLFQDGKEEEGVLDKILGAMR